MTDRGLQAITYPTPGSVGQLRRVPCAAGGGCVAKPRHPNYARSALTQHARTRHARATGCRRSRTTHPGFGRSVDLRACAAGGGYVHCRGIWKAARSARSSARTQHEGTPTCSTHARANATPQDAAVAPMRCSCPRMNSTPPPPRVNTHTSTDTPTATHTPTNFPVGVHAHSANTWS